MDKSETLLTVAEMTNPGAEMVEIRGRMVEITDKNRKFIEQMLEHDAEAAFESATVGQSGRSTPHAA